MSLDGCYLGDMWNMIDDSDKQNWHRTANSAALEGNMEALLEMFNALGDAATKEILGATLGSPINSDRFGNTPLIKAGDHADVVELLIARGAPVDAANNDRNTALHLAVGRGDAATAALLCRAGARRDVANAAGVTAARLAEQCGVSLPAEQCGVRLPPDDGPGEPEPELEPAALEPEPEPREPAPWEPEPEPPVASPPRARRPSGTVFAEGELEGFDEADLALMEQLTA